MTSRPLKTLTRATHSAGLFEDSDGGSSRRDSWEFDRHGATRISPRKLLDVRAVVRHPLRDDTSEVRTQAIVIEAAGRDQVILPVLAPLQLALVRHADAMAVHAELRVVHGVHDLDLRAVEDVDSTMVHLAHEDLVRAAFDPRLERDVVDQPGQSTDGPWRELGHLALLTVVVGAPQDQTSDVGK